MLVFFEGGGEGFFQVRAGGGEGFFQVWAGGGEGFFKPEIERPDQQFFNSIAWPITTALPPKEMVFKNEISKISVYTYKIPLFHNTK